MERDNSLTGMSYDEVQMSGALAFLDGLKLSNNPYKVSEYDIPTNDKTGIKKAVLQAARAWKCGFVTMKAES